MEKREEKKCIEVIENIWDIRDTFQKRFIHTSLEGCYFLLQWEERLRQLVPNARPVNKEASGTTFAICCASAFTQ